tara:strand:- start:42 stop:239 length:198 start_codon:yes stop_codon:yes gene_type:complete
MDARDYNEHILNLEDDNNRLRELLKESRDFLAKIGTLKPIIMQECKSLIEKINKERRYEHNNVGD